ncbi:conserved hypothetical protein [Xylanimonas cellulosilytica DSM 15894]|uniref:Uncharacterized protein n=1 Tax=Xylanimonas cellulosilytica (strain DSM 15894 / JCM 12276 / CECT 5975 / KCTC 9989 / LMG 20990 / NBRC 107835 / XIL07) TaxID=446471 RepID=D1BTJ0_XYLCX|nr:putative baseplate assembly protein [Xylanimonas cellulosilytica]ACZ30969.1 conserved hypothetical protein [Xylanimonas cellulosilytica DSM 15894]
MPLEDAIPVLDDRDHDAILAEMRSQIARYTPEWKPVWTDINDSDPGITMLQVFAWLGETLAYRMNRVPDLLYLKFLQLLGVELTPARPAQVEISFGVKATAPATVQVPRRTQVIAETPGGGPPLVFEAERALTCLKHVRKTVLVYDGAAHTDATRADADATGYEPFGPAANAGAALLLGFDATEPFPQTEVTFYAWVDSEHGGTSPVTCGPGADRFRPATLRWQYWDGTDWAELTVLEDRTAALTRSGSIVVRTPASALVATTIAPAPEPLFWLRALVASSQYERAPRILAIRPNTMTLTQMETVEGEVLGGSNGRRDQVFALSQTPVLDGSLTLTVDQRSGAETWREVPDLYAQGPADPVFVLNRTTGEIRFGDGVHGAVPIANPDNPGANVVAASYRYGGGTSGNVAAGTLTMLRSALEGIDDATVVNVRPSYGGSDEETIDSAKLRAPASVRARERAVTTDDFELFAVRAANIARAKAFPLYHPQFPETPIPGVVTVVVVPRSDSARPVPSEGTLRTVCAELQQRRLLTTEVYVAPPTYQRVSVEVRVVVAETADQARVLREIDAALLAYFHPLTGGDAGTGWPFGGAVSFSRVFGKVLDVPGVDSVDHLFVSLDGVEQPECRDVPIAAGALVFSTAHQVSGAYAGEA